VTKLIEGILRHGEMRYTGKTLEGKPKGRTSLGIELNAYITLVSTRILKKWTSEYVKWVHRCYGVWKKRPWSFREERVSHYLN
jgi:hypothetical protein